MRTRQRQQFISGLLCSTLITACAEAPKNKAAGAKKAPAQAAATAAGETAPHPQITPPTYGAQVCAGPPCTEGIALSGFSTEECRGFGAGWSYDVPSGACRYAVTAQARNLALPIPVNVCMQLGSRWALVGEKCTFDLSPLVGSPAGIAPARPIAPASAAVPGNESPHRVHAGGSEARAPQTPGVGNAPPPPERFPICESYLAPHSPPGNGLGLTGGSAFAVGPLLEEAQESLQGQVPSHIAVVPDPASYRAGPREQVTFRLTYNHIPFCDLDRRAVEIAGRAKVLGSGPKAPFPREEALAALTWAEGDVRIDEMVRRGDLKGTVRDLIKKACIALGPKGPQPAWHANFLVGGVPYQGWQIEGRVVSVEPGFLTLGEATVGHFPKHPATGTEPTTREEVTISGLSGEGILCSPQLQVTVGAGESQVAPDGSIAVARPAMERAHDPGHRFVYELTDPRAGQAALFANGRAHLDWMLGLVPGLTLERPITIEVPADPARGPVYLLPRGAEPPKVVLGAGDGQNLKNLHFDGDVIAHELTHYFIYRTIKSVTGDALILHEGIADFFVFARTGDPCLGEWICPAGSDVCGPNDPSGKWLCADCSEGCRRCLRSAARPTQGHGAHLKGQKVASLLWDLSRRWSEGSTGAQSFQDNLREVAALTLTAMDFLTATPTLEDFLAALVAADADLFDGQHQCALSMSATLEDFPGASSVTCGDGLPGQSAVERYPQLCSAQDSLLD